MSEYFKNYRKSIDNNNHGRVAGKRVNWESRHRPSLITYLQASRSVSRIVVTHCVPTVNQPLNLDLIYETRHERTRPWDRTHSGNELALSIGGKGRQWKPCLPNKSSTVRVVSQYPSAGMSHLQELLGRPNNFRPDTPKKTADIAHVDLSLSRALVPSYHLHNRYFTCT